MTINFTYKLFTIIAGGLNQIAVKIFVYSFQFYQGFKSKLFIYFLKIKLLYELFHSHEHFSNI